VDLDIKVAQVVVVRDSFDAGDAVTCCQDMDMMVCYGCAYGSAMRRSVSLMIRLGRAMLCGCFLSARTRVLLRVVGWISPKQSEAEADNRMEQKDDDDDGCTPLIANSSPIWKLRRFPSHHVLP
jgi:hypothetical protein